MNNYQYKIQLSDLGLCATLDYFGFPIIETMQDPQDTTKVIMVFNKTKDIEDLIKEYWSGSVAVEPKRFWSITRDIKSRIRGSHLGRKNNN